MFCYQDMTIIIFTSRHWVSGYGVAGESPANNNSKNNEVVSTALAAGELCRKISDTGLM